jgi:hypothetical protein
MGVERNGRGDERRVRKWQRKKEDDEGSVLRCVE